MTLDSPATAHFMLSSYRETLVEHRLLADLLTVAWLRGEVLEVSRAETDQYGYDIVLARGPTTRHVQVKSSISGGRTRSQTAHIALESKPSACIVWVVLEQTRDSVECPQYLFFGGPPGARIPSMGDRLGRNPRSKTDRPATRVIPKSRFTRIDTVAGLYAALFGES